MDRSAENDRTKPLVGWSMLSAGGCVRNARNFRAARLRYKPATIGKRGTLAELQKQNQYDGTMPDLARPATPRAARGSGL
jgi:hypothetical protein